MTKDEALMLAMEAMEITGGFDVEINAIKEALAQPEQEPVAYGMWDTMLGKGNRMMMVRLDKGQDGCTVPLYTTPPQPEPVIDKSAAVRIATALGWEPKREPLTDEQIMEMYNEPRSDAEMIAFARAIEAAHGIGEQK